MSSTLSVQDAVSLTSSLSVSGSGIFAAGVQPSAVARTATDGGTGSGAIAHGTTFVSVTSSGSSKVITLPPSSNSASSCPVGHTVRLFSSSAYSLQTSSSTSVALQGVTGNSCTTVVALNTLLECHCVSSSQWTCTTTSLSGVAGTQGSPSCTSRRSMLSGLLD